MNEQIEQFLQALREAIGEYGPLPADQAGGALILFLFLVQWSAIILAALAGLYAARKSGMDLYGSVVIAFVTALGGGTVRDLLLGRSIFWIREPLYAVTVVVISILSVVIRVRFI
jgi:uncharacterized membrane protein YeiH